MRVIVVDTNKIMAAIIRPGRVRRLLFTAEAVLITPVHAWEEVMEKVVEVARRKGLNATELSNIINEIRRKVIIEAEPKEPYKSRAKRIAEKLRPGRLALHCSSTRVWCSVMDE